MVFVFGKRIISRIEKVIFLLLIFSIPFQKRFFLFGTDPAGGVFDEWSSGFFYFTDFLAVVLFILWLRYLNPKLSFAWLPARRGLGRLSQILLAFAILAFVSVTQADLFEVSLYRAIKLAGFVFLFFYTAFYVGRLTSHIEIRKVLWVFVASGVFQSILAILQFAKQSSLGLEIFHESTLAIHLKGVAHILSSDGSFLIRAYGTFPSPNVLAGFLGLCLLILFYLMLEKSYLGRSYPPAHSRPSSEGLRGSGGFAPRCGSGTMPNPPSNPLEDNFYLGSLFVLGRIIIVFLLSFAFILTFSRGTIMFFVFVAGIFFAGIFLLKIFREYRKTAIRLAGLIIASWLLIIAVAWPEVSARFLGSSIDEPALQERFYFNKVGMNTVQQDIGSAIFGIGMGNFTHNFRQVEPGLPEKLYQPVHNIFILIASEMGILGFFAFVIFIALLTERLLQKFLELYQNEDIQIRRYSSAFVYLWSLIAIFCFFLLIAMYDHYFLTLQQGGLMFWIVLGLIVGIVTCSSSSKTKMGPS